jgi:hypothetical protein
MGAASVGIEMVGHGEDNLMPGVLSTPVVSCPKCLCTMFPMENIVEDLARTFREGKRIHYHNPQVTLITFSCMNGHVGKKLISPTCWCGWQPKDEPNKWWDPEKTQ